MTWHNLLLLTPHQTPHLSIIRFDTQGALSVLCTLHDMPPPIHRATNSAAGGGGCDEVWVVECTEYNGEYIGELRPTCSEISNNRHRHQRQPRTTTTIQSIRPFNQRQFSRRSRTISRRSRRRRSCSICQKNM